MKIRGAGGGGKSGGGGSSRTPIEAADSLKSRQYAKVVDLISEGPISNLVGGVEGIYLNETPIQNNGAPNFSGVSIEVTYGTIDQAPLYDFNGASSEVAVGVEVTKLVSVTRTINNSEVDVARLTIGVPQLTNQNMTNGDVSGTSVQLKVELQSNGGGYQVVNGYSSRFNVSASINLNVASATVADSEGSGLFYTIIPPYQTIDMGEGAPQQTNYLPFQIYIEYKGPGDVDWVFYETQVFAGSTPTVSENFVIRGPGNSGTWQVRATATPTGSPINYTGAQFTSAGAYRIFYGVSVDITGKTTSRYRRTFDVPLTGSAPWDIRITRLTDDSVASNLVNETWWDSYSEIINGKFNYPFSAVCGLTIDSSQFSSIPSRGYLVDGLIVQIPSNYDPLARSYSGIWDGMFQPSWTSNPAWIFYDLVTNDRYGLGQLVSPDLVDIWSLYEISQYCDEKVPSGDGYLEPRYTCNAYIQTRNDAYRLLSSIVSIFRGSVFWSGGAINVSADMPSDPIAVFNDSNVIDGNFTYSGSAKRARHTVALVTWNDPADLYRQKVEYVEDPDGIALYGVNSVELVAFGCTSRGQAARVGRWTLYSERLETEIVTFKTGLEGTTIYPGALIAISDSGRAQVRSGGRVLAHMWEVLVEGVRSKLTLDSTPVIEEGVDNYLTCVTELGDVETRLITEDLGDNIIRTMFFNNEVQDGAVWVLTSENVALSTYRVLSVAESGKLEIEVSALQHDPNKYDLIESDPTFNTPETGQAQRDPPSPVESLAVVETKYPTTPTTTGTKFTLSWIGNTPFYEVSWRRIGINATNWTTIEVQSANFEMLNVVAGTYEFSIQAVDSLRRKSTPVTATEVTDFFDQIPDDVSFVVVE